MNPKLYSILDGLEPARSAVCLWGGNADSVEHCRTGESCVYRFRTNHSRQFFLRLTHPEHRNRDELEAEIEFLLHLQGTGVAIAQPARSLSGEYVELQRVSSLVFHAAVFSALQGTRLYFHSEGLNAQFFSNWGTVLARIHSASDQFGPCGLHRRYDWNEDYVLSIGLSVPRDREPIVSSVLHDLYAELTELPRSESNFGLIHGDFGLSNMVVHKGLIQAIDFDDCCYNWYIADIANALWPFRSDPPAGRPDRRQILDWFLQGYQMVRPIDEMIMEKFSSFIRYRTAFLFFNFLIRDWDNPTSDQRRWLEKNRAFLGEPFDW